MDTHPIPWNNDYDQFTNVLNCEKWYDVKNFTIIS